MRPELSRDKTAGAGREMTTIKDIARESGYSVGTVSRVLNGHKNVSDKARTQIMAVVDKYNFQLNGNAKLLKQRGTRGIAVLLKGAQNMLFNALTELFQSKLDEFEYECDVFYLNEDDNEVDFAQRICRERKPEGILFLGANLKFFRSGFAGINVPCVLVTIDGSELGFENLSSITTDDRRAAEHIIDMLVEHGHTKIGVIGGNPETSTASKERLFGCRRAFARNGIEFDEFRQYEKSHFSLEGGYSAAGKLFRKMPDVTAIYGMSDVTAIGAIRAAADRGIRIPEDLSIVGFDGIDLADYVTPRLTTIRQNREAIAARSIEILIDMIRGGSAVHEVIPFILIPGNSIRQI